MVTLGHVTVAIMTENIVNIANGENILTTLNKVA